MAGPVKIGCAFGINYEDNPDSQLFGCVNDVKNETEVLFGHLGYDPDWFTIMTDHTVKKPTLENMVTALINLAKMTHEYPTVQEVWISYSGHGTFVHDEGEGSGDERDQRDECLVPLDYMKGGLLKDDTLNHILALMHPRVSVFIKADCCHSGSIFDLRYRFQSGSKTVEENPGCQIKARVFMLSGCRDKQVSMDNIQRTVAEYYKIKVADLMSRRRSRSVARPRQVAMALAKELTNHSLPEIGDSFGGRDHTTVLHGCRKIKELRESNSDISEDYKNLLRSLTT